MNLDQPSSGATGTSANLVSLFARSEAKDSLEKSANTMCRRHNTATILQDFDVVAILRVAMYFVHMRYVFLLKKPGT